MDQDDIDDSIDYYRVLGLLPNATIENIKTSYVQLAPKYHPDTSGAKSNSAKDKASKKFKEISEAYAILSRKETKNKYDYMRNRKLSNAKFSVDIDTSSLPKGNLTSTISDGYTTQKNHYQTHVKYQASSTARRDKYKTEKWQNMALKDKKDSRRVPLKKLGGNTASIIPTIIVIAVGSYAYTQYSLT